MKTVHAILVVIDLTTPIHILFASLNSFVLGANTLSATNIIEPDDAYLYDRVILIQYTVSLNKFQTLENLL